MAELPYARVGPYEVVGELGRGGMGVVLEARHERLGTPVALKVALQPLEPELRERLEREARACLSLRHPGVVEVTDFGWHQGRPYLVMALLRGESLEQRLRRGPLPPEEALRTGRALAEALAYVHGRGLVHRDVKPANVLLRADGSPLLADFGLVREAGPDAQRLTRTGELLGTPAYMAPEQANGEGVRAGPASDVYSLGATLVHMLTGRPPFTGASALGVLEQVVTSAAPAPSELRPELGRRYDALLGRCLAKDPAARPTAREVVAELDRLQTDAGHAGRRALLAAGGILGLGLLAAGVLLAGRPQARPPSPSAATPPAPTADVEALLAEASALGRERRWAEAEARLVAAQVARPDLDAPWLEQAALLITADSYAIDQPARERAARALEHVLARDPAQREALALRTVYVAQMGSPHEEILAAAERAQVERADSLWSWIARATACWIRWNQTSRPDQERLQALHELYQASQEALRFDGGAPLALSYAYQARLALARGGQLDFAELQRAQEADALRDPTDPMLRYHAAASYWAEVEPRVDDPALAPVFDQALAGYAAALQLDPSFLPPLRDRSYALACRGVFAHVPEFLPRALADAREAGRRAPTDVFLQWTVGHAFRLCGELREAEQAFATAAEWSGGGNIYLVLGDVRCQLGDYAGAAKAYREAVARLAPDDELLPTARFKLDSVASEAPEEPDAAPR